MAEALIVECFGRGRGGLGLVQNQATFSAVRQEPSASESAAGPLHSQFCILHSH
jgi:hypothetical protein